MVKEYRVYKLKYGIMKYEIVSNGISLSYHKNEVSLQLSEAILKHQGYTKLGETMVKELVIMEVIDEEETDEGEDWH